MEGCGGWNLAYDGWKEKGQYSTLKKIKKWEAINVHFQLVEIW